MSVLLFDLGTIWPFNWFRRWRAGARRTWQVARALQVSTGLPIHRATLAEPLTEFDKHARLTPADAVRLLALLTHAEAAGRADAQAGDDKK